MAASDENSNRHVIPRWVPFKDALSSNELGSGTVTNNSAVNGEDFVQEKEAAWLSARTMPFAIDLVSAAIVLGRTAVAEDAAKFILEGASGASTIVQNLARHLLGAAKDVSEATIQSADTHSLFTIQAAKELKSRRISQPRNAFVWADLARLYVLLGQIEPARQALRVALSLAPTDRFILRVNARFFHHIRDHERALDLLRKNPRTPFDPWLVAAEIAASSMLERSPRFIKIGEQFVKNGNVPPFHISELTSALASLRMADGDRKQANKLFTQSLNQPTANALAQVVWASKRTGLGHVNPDLFQGSRSSEAQTLDDFNEGSWISLIAHAENWINEEGFSTRPRMLASAVATSILDQHHLGETIARDGLAINPGHPGLVNNLAFALIHQGKAEEALKSIETVNEYAMTPINAICLLATAGMAKFRLGDEVEGRHYYELAIENAKQRGLNDLKTLATLYLARELALRQNAEGYKQFATAYAAATKVINTTLPAIADHLADELEILAKAQPSINFLIDRKKAPLKLKP